MEGKIKRPDTLKVHAIGWIRDLLATGKLKTDVVYSANHFAKVLGISRTPAREALLQLTSEGYFISLLGRGFKIRSFTKKEIIDFFETRRLIETYVIRHIENLLTADIRASFEDNLKQLAKAGANEDVYKFLDLDKSFHMLLTDLYKNEQFVSIMENIRGLMTIMGQRALSKPQRFPEVIAEHHLIIDSLAERDIDKAVVAMSDHINLTEQSVLAM